MRRIRLLEAMSLSREDTWENQANYYRRLFSLKYKMLAAQGKSHSTYTNLRYDGGPLTTFQVVKCTTGFKLNTAVMGYGNGKFDLNSVYLHIFSRACPWKSPRAPTVPLVPAHSGLSRNGCRSVSLVIDQVFGMSTVW
jgi:hypothetical protein